LSNQPPQIETRVTQLLWVNPDLAFDETLGRSYGSRHAHPNRHPAGRNYAPTSDCEKRQALALIDVPATDDMIRLGKVEAGHLNVNIVLV
jgi:hypothetical protein